MKVVVIGKPVIPKVANKKKKALMLKKKKALALKKKKALMLKKKKAAFMVLR